jgi:hypothetical protein
MVDLLEIPTHLIARPGSRRKIPTVQWKGKKQPRPEGDKWQEAQKWNICVPPEWGNTKVTVGRLATGTRMVWALIGRKWVEIRDAEGYVKVALSDWQRVVHKGNGRDFS